jgi:hypothetical protein
MCPTRTNAKPIGLATGPFGVVDVGLNYSLDQIAHISLRFTPEERLIT